MWWQSYFFFLKKKKKTLIVRLGFAWFPEYAVKVASLKGLNSDCWGFCFFFFDP